MSSISLPAEQFMAASEQRKGARRERSAGQKLNSWFASHRNCAADALRRMMGQPMTTLMTLMVIGIALLLPALLYIAAANISQFSGSLSQSNQITAYLDDNISTTDIESLLDTVSAHTLVSQVYLTTPAQAAAEFAQWSGLGEVLVALAENPLPASIHVQATDAAATSSLLLAQWLGEQPGVTMVQTDQDWLQRLDSAVSLVTRSAQVLIGILALAVLFITGNSIRSLIAGRAAEIKVMTLIGASRAYVARPFLYLGLCYGLLGATLAWLMLLGMLMIVRQPAVELLAFYGEQYVFVGLSLRASMILLTGGAALGWLGARLSVSRHLSQFG
jgi:cell division transport system permease protein